MLSFLYQFPDHILCHLFCDWLVIRDILGLDCAFNNHKDLWDNNLRRVISDSSSLSPFHSHQVYFSLPLWFWLIDRNIYIKALLVDDFETHFETLNLLLSRLFPNNADKEKILTSTEVSSAEIKFERLTINLAKGLSILKHIEYLAFIPRKIENGLEITKVDKMLTSLYSYCWTNLKVLILYKCDISESGLSSVLEANKHCLIVLNVTFCPNLGPLSLWWPSSLSLPNMNMLVLRANYPELNDDHWYPMLGGMSNLNSLEIYPIAVSLWKKAKLHLLKLKYLTIKLIIGDGDDDLKELFPQSLKSLYLFLEFETISNSRFQELMTIDQLTNLKELTLCKISEETVFDDSENLSLTLPISLSEINLSYM
eukprot:gene14859-19975_t